MSGYQAEEPQFQLIGGLKTADGVSRCVFTPSMRDLFDPCVCAYPPFPWVIWWEQCWNMAAANKHVEMSVSRVPRGLWYRLLKSVRMKSKPMAVNYPQMQGFMGNKEKDAVTQASQALHNEVWTATFFSFLHVFLSDINTRESELLQRLESDMF